MRQSKEIKKIRPILEKFLELSIETFSLLDMLWDLIILKQLYKHHLAWATVICLTILCPYFISYSPLLTFYQQSQKKDPSYRKSVLQKVINFSFMTPLVLINTFLLDLFYIILTVTFIPIIILFSNC